MIARIEEDALTIRLYRRIGCAEAMIEFPKGEWMALIAEWNSMQLASATPSETMADE